MARSNTRYSPGLRNVWVGDETTEELSSPNSHRTTSKSSDRLVNLYVNGSSSDTCSYVKSAKGFGSGSSTTGGSSFLQALTEKVSSAIKHEIFKYFIRK